MSTFSQFRSKFLKESKVKLVTWVCGSERILVSEVIHMIQTSLKVDAWNVVTLSVGDDSERAVWNEILQLPMGHTGTRLTIIHHAEKLKNDIAFHNIVMNRLKSPKSYIIFVSDEETLRRMPPAPGEKYVKGKGELIPTLAYLYGKGDLVECKPFTEATAKHAVDWLQEKATIRPNVAAHLLNRADGDLRLVRDVVEKIALFPGETTLTVINSMLEQKPRDSFTDALIALDKKTALQALVELPRAEWSRTLGLLDSRLDLAGMVHDMQIEHRTSGEIAKAAGSRSFLVKDILPVAKHYDRKRRAQIREILSVVDQYSQVGYLEGNMEAVVAFW